MYQNGLETNDHIIADGRLHRFHVLRDRKGTKNGWYIFYPDFPAVGVFGCWKRYMKRKWQQNIYNKMIVSDRRKLNDRCRSMKIRSDHEFKIEHDALRETAEIWQSARTASDRHGYLVRKGVRSHGLRYYRGALLVPVTDPDGDLHGLQRIWPNGDKRFSKGTVLTGNFFMIGGLSMETILICEGYSTGATLHEITGHTVVMSFSSGNLRPVAEVVRSAWPSSRIFICADDDYNVHDNPGLSAAAEAANTIFAGLIVPHFPEIRGAYDTDFNDLFKLAGAAAVVECLSSTGDYHANV
jgi:putative DNA primase/helicase